MICYSLSVFFAFATFVLLLLINISGAGESTFLVKTLALSKLDLTSGNTLYWTMYRACRSNSGEFSCSDTRAGYPYDPLDFSTLSYLRSLHRALRAAYALFLAALISSFINVVFGLVGYFDTPSYGSHHVGRKSANGWLRNYNIQCVFTYVITIVAALVETGVHARGVSQLNDLDGFDAHIGVAMQVLMWIAVGVAFEAMFLGLWSGGCRWWKRSRRVHEEELYGSKF